MTHGLGCLCENKNRRALGAQVAGLVGHLAGAREDDELRLVDGVREHHGGADGFLPLGGENGVVRVARAAAQGDAPRHAVEHLHAINRVFALRRLAAEHHGVGLFKDSIRHIGDLGTGRNRVGDHAFEHVGGDDHGAAKMDALFDDPALDDREFLHLAFDAEVATGHHDGIGGADDVFDITHGVLILDFGDCARVGAKAAEHAFEFQNIGGLAAKTQRHKIHAHLDAEFDILEVFFRERREVHLHAGKVDVAAGTKISLGEDLALHAVGVFFQHLHVDDPVVHEHDIAHMDVVHEAVVIHIHRVVLLALRAAHGEFKNIAGLEIQLRREIAGADRGALRIEKDRAIHIQTRGDAADALHNIAHPIVPRMAHVQAKNIRSSQHEVADDDIRIRGRPERANDFCFSHSPINRLVS